MSTNSNTHSGFVTSRRLVTVICSAAAASAALITAAVPASATAGGVTPNACPSKHFYSVSNSLGRFVRDSRKTVYGQPGVTLSVSAEKGTQWSGTVGGSVEGDVGFILASAKATVSASVTYSKTTTVALGGVWTVPAGKNLGWLALGSQGYVMSWQYGENTPRCRYSRIRGGSASLPALSPVIGHS